MHFVATNEQIESVLRTRAKGKKIKASMEKQYGKERGDRIFYAAENKGTIKGVAKKAAKKKK